MVPGQVPQAESADLRASARRGDEFERFVAEGWAERVALGLLTHEAADQFGTSPANVSRWMAAWREDELARRRQGGWVRLAEVEDALTDFSVFRARYFTDHRGDPYLVKPFHQRWIDSILQAMESGGRRMILSPPRHGKSDLLTHFCVWLICLNPNIRIMWVGGNEDIAKLCVGAVLDTLENNEKLIAEVLGPEGRFRPASKSGRSWSSTNFTVGTREGTGIKSPTMVAIGKGGKLLSRDADLIIADDIQDQNSVWQPGQREKDVRWWNVEISSRKEAHTGLVVIGSRQHHEDLYGRLASNDEWDAIVESAHDPECPLPVHGPTSGHDKDCVVCAEHTDCVLFPELRPMWFLQSQKAAMQDDTLFDMVYLNVTRAVGDAYVTAEQIEKCKDLDRTIGHVPPGSRLIAGLDPAVGKSGQQAAVLWAYHPESKVRHLVDIDVRVAGGPSHMREIVRTWFDKYRCAEWVFEDNAAQAGWLEDSEFRDLLARNGILVHQETTTAQSKWNPVYGVLHQFGLIRQDPPLINLPWGDEFTRDIVRVLIFQWVNFDPAIGRNNRSKTKSDVQMAAWLPELRIRYWLRSQQSEVVFGYEQSTPYDSGLGGSYVSVLEAA